LRRVSVQYCRELEAENRNPSAAHATKETSVVAIALHCLRMKKYPKKTAGVSLMATAMPVRTPRQREVLGTARMSMTTRATRIMLICPKLMVWVTGSVRHAATRSQQAQVRVAPVLFSGAALRTTRYKMQKSRAKEARASSKELRP